MPNLYPKPIARDADPLLGLRAGNEVDTSPARATDLMGTLMATGASRGEAIGGVVGILGSDAAHGIFQAFLDTSPTGPEVLEALDAVAQWAPRAANAWLGDSLSSGRLKSWAYGPETSRTQPEGVELRGRDWITSLPDNLDVSGNLALTSCRHLRHLPRGLHVEKGLYLNGCSALEAIPDGLQVGGAIWFTKAHSLRHVGAGLVLAGNFVIQDAPRLTRLPDGLRVGGGLVCMGTGITRLPRDLSVARQLNLKRCPIWDGVIPMDADLPGTLSTDMHPDGILLPDWRKAHPMGERPERQEAYVLVDTLLATGELFGEALVQAGAMFGFDAARGAFLGHLTEGGSGRTLRDDLQCVAWADPAAANQWLNDALASGLMNEWSENGSIGLHLDGMDWVTSLPEELHLQGELWVSRCDGLTAIPNGIRAEAIYAAGCQNLTSLPDGLSLALDLELEGCGNLTRLPEGMRVGGTANISGCDRLTALPGGMRVMEDLCMKVCPAWDGVIPADAEIAGKIVTDAHPGGLFLSDWRASEATGRP